MLVGSSRKRKILLLIFGVFLLLFGVFVVVEYFQTDEVVVRSIITKWLESVEAGGEPTEHERVEPKMSHVVYPKGVVSWNISSIAIAPYYGYDEPILRAVVHIQLECRNANGGIRTAEWKMVLLKEKSPVPTWVPASLDHLWEDKKQWYILAVLPDDESRQK